jgi:hypothetical protein
VRLVESREAPAERSTSRVGGQSEYRQLDFS